MFRDHRVAKAAFAGSFVLALAVAGLMPVLATALCGGTDIGQMLPGHDVVSKAFGGHIPCWKARTMHIRTV
jgi:hypothetical protein